MSKKWEILRKNDFWEKTFFFVMSIWVEILRLPHSFWLWGCWEFENIVKFRIFRGFPSTFSGFQWTFFKKTPQIWSWKSSDFDEIDDVHGLPAPPQPKTMRQTKYLDPNTHHEKKSFFFRNQNFAIFFTFFDFSKSRFSKFGQSGDAHRPTWGYLSGEKKIPTHFGSNSH